MHDVQFYILNPGSQIIDVVLNLALRWETASFTIDRREILVNIESFNPCAWFISQLLHFTEI